MTLPPYRAQLALLVDRAPEGEGWVHEAKYDGYIDRQLDQIDRFRRLEDKPIPPGLDYRAIAQLRCDGEISRSQCRSRP